MDMLDMLDMLDQADCQHFKREAYHYYLNNCPQRQESGCYSEVNILVLSEVTTKSVSMKLRHSTVLRGRRQKLKHVKDSERIIEVLDDSDSRQSDSVEEIKDNVSVICDTKRPVRKSRAGGSCRARKDKWPLSIVESRQKISLAPGAMAEDTLEKLRLMVNASEPESRPRSPVESLEELETVLDESCIDLTVESGPSSPCRPADTIRCRDCERLFAKMRKQPTLKKKSRDKNPASLSCDVWVLLKKWHPQRLCHRERGLLWTSLRDIRKWSAQGSGSAAVNRAQLNCSRPHVFQQRNLRRCKYLTSIQTDVSITRANARHHKKSQAVTWPPVGRWNNSVKKKPSMNHPLSEQLSPLNVCVRETQDDKPLLKDKLSKLKADLKLNSDAISKQRTNVQGKLSKQETYDGIDGTRRVLKFDDTPETVAVETAEQKKSPRLLRKRREIGEAQDEQQGELSEDSHGFRTPTDLFSVKPKIKRGNQTKVSASGDTKSAVQKPNFMSLLATMVKNHNQIIKETCK